MSGEVTRDEQTGFIFGFGYLTEYRFYRSEILFKDLEKIDEMLPDLEEARRDNLKLMIKLEIVMNAVRYCADLAGMILTSRKPVSEWLKNISSIHETGAGSIYEFYELIPSQKTEYFWDLMGYNKIKLEGDLTRYERSAEKLKNNLIKVAVFYQEYYDLYTAYKHGLRLFIFTDEITGRDTLFVACRDNTFTTQVFLKPIWEMRSLEIVDIVHRIFTSVVEPLISWIALPEKADVEVTEKKLTVTMKSAEPPDPERPYRFSGSFTFPWKSWKKYKEKKIPFYP